MPAYRPIEERFAEKYRVNQETGCWNWTATRIKGGYGHLKLPREGGLILAHRFAYEHFVGEIPNGMIVRHACNNSSCVNPKHLVLGTHSENMNDMVATGRRIGRGTGTALNGQQMRRLKRLLSSGKTQQQAADALGIHRSTVQRIGYRGELSMQPNVSGARTLLGTIDKNAVLSDLRAGMNVSAVARKHNIDRKTVRNIRSATPQISSS